MGCPRKYDGDYAERKRQAARAWLKKHREHSRELFAAAAKRRKFKDPVKVFFGGLKARAQGRYGDDFNLTLEYIRELMAPMICSQTGHELSWDWPDGQGPNPWAPSLDRIRSSEGYVEGNVQVVSWIYNRCKGEWPDEIVRQFRGAGPVRLQD